MGQAREARSADVEAEQEPPLVGDGPGELTELLGQHLGVCRGPAAGVGVVESDDGRPEVRFETDHVEVTAGCGHLVGEGVGSLTRVRIQVEELQPHRLGSGLVRRG
jgi:hypothetical protein